MWFDTIKRFYDMGHPSYTMENMRGFVKAGMLTAEESQIITGVPYEE